MGKDRLRIYVDTSVFGGVFDREFAESSKIFLNQAKLSIFDLATSGLVVKEIRKAPEKVRELYEQFSKLLEVVDLNEKAFDLQEAYLRAGIVSGKYADDALHVAVATVAKCQVVVSWNFKHLVNFQKVPKYNAVNVLEGYAPLSILSPLEVLYYEDENPEKEEI